MDNTSVLREKADALAESNQLPAAAGIYEQICSIDAGDVGTWLALADLYWRLDRRQETVRCYQKAIELEPGNPDSHHKLGVALHASGVLPKARESYQKALQLNPNLPETWYHLGNLFKDQGRLVAAEKMYRQSLQLNPQHARAHCYLGDMLRGRSLTDEAIASYDRALEIEPELSEAKWGRLRILPIIYENSEEKKEYRQRYVEGLRQLDEQLSLKNSKERMDALLGLSVSTSFFLQYQGENDRALQQEYGKLVERIMAASFPQWSKPVGMPPVRRGERIRIGYASAFLREHNGAVWLLGWLRHCDKSRFEIYCYHTGDEIDDRTKEFMECSDHFYHIPGNLAKPCQQIVADRLHLLVYPELGMYAPTQMMAGLYLAPVQCTSWGHPVTSGLSTIDYWLSSDLMEPENGQQHYTETLVRLPNIAISYSRNQSDFIGSRPVEKQRSDFGLREDAILYFCAQSLYKYLPEYDHLFLEIARQVPGAQLVFITVLNKDVENRFVKRIRGVFRDAGLDADDYCVILPRLSADDYLTMNRLVDVFLDNPPWSGANTTLTAIDCDLPVVTWPTEFMRGRHSYAILKMLGLLDTVANNAGEYVEIAVRLGVDDVWRQAMVRRIRETRHKLYNDTSCVKGLEAFYERAVRSRLNYGDQTPQSD